MANPTPAAADAPAAAQAAAKDAPEPEADQAAADAPAAAQAAAKDAPEAEADQAAAKGVPEPASQEALNAQPAPAFGSDPTVEGFNAATDLTGFVQYGNKQWATFRRNKEAVYLFNNYERVGRKTAKFFELLKLTPMQTLDDTKAVGGVEKKAEKEKAHQAGWTELAAALDQMAQSPIERERGLVLRLSISECLQFLTCVAELG
ncbi:hypothetical protein HDU80_002274 [Chytriomyces hyalinus]|nr:hypothetical protein HDU80_002274 [Chytriomyces hyalinus]